MRSVVLAGCGTNAHPARTGESAPRREIRFYSQRSDVLIETIGVHHLCPSPHEVFHEFLLCVVAPIHLRRDRAIQGPFLARRARGRTDTAEVAEGRRRGSAPPDHSAESWVPQRLKTLPVPPPFHLPTRPPISVGQDDDAGASILWPSVDRPCGQSAPDATTPLRFVA
jgi:hypothetical protein